MAELGKQSYILQHLVGKMLFKIGKSFYILLTDVLSSKEKDCCINPQSCEI
jgi:hypothetical protein